MLKLKYLYENINLATMMVKNYSFDNLDYFKYYRISANAVYPFIDKEEVKYLRLAPSEEREFEHIIYEMDILQYLEENNFPAIRVVKSKCNNYVIDKDTPFGEYYATVFEKVPGICIEELDLNDDLVIKMGESLAQLHMVLKNHDSNRDSFREKLDWIENELIELEDKWAIDKLKKLKEDFKSITINSDNYGLIHYDYELDNLFYDEQSGIIYPIDFDDSMHHLYVMDILQTLDSFEDRRSEFETSFLEGYKKVKDISKEYEKEMRLCKRFANLYKYVRVSRASKDKWENEPSWLLNLRIKLDKFKESQHI